MTPVDIFAGLLKLAVDIAGEATAEQKATMLAQVEDAKARIAALPSLSVAVHDAAEARRVGLRASTKRDPAPPEGE